MKNKIILTLLSLLMLGTDLGTVKASASTLNEVPGNVEVDTGSNAQVLDNFNINKDEYLGDMPETSTNIPDDVKSEAEKMANDIGMEVLSVVEVDTTNKSSSQVELDIDSMINSIPKSGAQNSTMNIQSRALPSRGTMVKAAPIVYNNVHITATFSHRLGSYNNSSSNAWGWDFTDANNGVSLGKGKWTRWDVMTMRSVVNGSTVEYLVYCIAPTIPRLMATNAYKQAPTLLNSYPAWVRDRIWAIAYYGYGYGGDTSIYRYMIAQELIWESLPLGYSDSSYTKNQGTIVNYIEDERSVLRPYRPIVKNLAKSHYTYPSLKTSATTTTVGSTFTITDSNNKLMNYNVTFGKGLAFVSQTASTITLRVTGATDGSASNVTLTEKGLSNNRMASETMGWVTDGSVLGQPMYTFGLDSRNMTYSFKVNASLGNVEINKTGSINGSAPKPLAGAVFEISYNKDFTAGQTWTYTTDAKGYIYSPNYNIGTVYVREKSAPAPYVKDPKVYTYNVTSGKTVTHNSKNEHALTYFEINKTDEWGTRIGGIEFKIYATPYKEGNAPLATVTTNGAGLARTGNLPIGTYHVIETKKPEYKPWSGNVTVKYANDSTGVIKSPVNIVNYLTPIAEIGLDRILIDTKPTSSGLVVESWNSVKKNYDWGTGGHGDTVVYFDLYDNSAGKLITTKQYKVKETPSKIDFNVPANYQAVGTKKVYEVRLRVSNTSGVTVVRDKVSTEGYTSQEKTFTNTSDNLTTSFTGVIRTSRTYGQNIAIVNETIKVTVPKLEKQRTGYGFTYDFNVDYANPLNPGYLNMSDISRYSLNVPKSTIDNTVGLVTSGNDVVGRFVAASAASGKGKYTLPRVDIQKNTGKVLKSGDTSVTAANKVNGLNKLYVPVWSNLGKYTTSFKASNLGVHKINVVNNDTLDVYAHMMTTIDSATKNIDAILLIPVMTENPFTGSKVNKLGQIAPEGFTKAMVDKVKAWNKFAPAR